MPIDCLIALPRLTEDEMRSIDYEVMSHAFAAQNDLGRLCDESVYKFDMANRLTAAGINANVEVPILLKFQRYSTTLFMDLVVDNRVPYELKAVTELTVNHKHQLLNYLLLTNATRGKIINFRGQSVDSRYVNSTFDHRDRRQFDIDDSHWMGDSSFQDLVISLLRDWGTCLELPLYVQALIDCLGGPDHVIQSLPMNWGGHAIGNQRFHLADDHTAFRMTAFPEGVKPSDAAHLEKLLRPSPLIRLYWVNIGRRELRFQSLES